MFLSFAEESSPCHQREVQSSICVSRIFRWYVQETLGVDFVFSTDKVETLSVECPPTSPVLYILDIGSVGVPGGTIPDYLWVDLRQRKR